MNTITDMDALQEWAFEDDSPTSEEAITHAFARELVWIACEEAITHAFARELVWIAEAARRCTRDFDERARILRDPLLAHSGLAQKIREEQKKMSTPEQQQVSESRSSVTLSKNAKGDRQQVVKVYEGTSEEEMARIVDVALSTYQELEQGGAE